MDLEGQKSPSLIIPTLALLFVFFLFEFLLAPRVVPAYTVLRVYRLILMGLTFMVMALFLFHPGLVKGGESVFLIVMVISRMDEVLYVLPRFHNPSIWGSLFIFTNLMTLYTLILSLFYYRQLLHASGFLIFSLIYETLYFQKLKDLSFILLLLVMTITFVTAIIARLLRSESRQKEENRELYKEENRLKKDIALLKGRLLEQEKNFSLSLLSAGIAHELGNPVNFLQGNLIFTDQYLKGLMEMLEKKSLNQEEESFLTMVRKNYEEVFEHSQAGIERIVQVMERVKGLYGKSSWEKSITDIKEILTHTADFFRLSRKERHYSLEIHALPGLYAPVRGEDYFTVFSNLFANALDALNSQDEPGVILIEAARKGNLIEVSVSDNGSGLPDVDTSRLTDPFFSTKKTKHNMGLGLALCHEIIQHDGGSMTFQKNTPRGTRVIVTIRTERDGQHED